MGSLPTIRIFFSSPGDVKMERETARRIVERLQTEAAGRAVLEPYFWEHEVMVATKDYQQNIPAMDGFDLVVCILWSRLGSPLHPGRHPRPGGGFFESGTEYEFFTAMEAHKAQLKPDILVFRNRTEPRRPSRPREAREAVDREVDRLDQFFERYFREGEYFTAAVNGYRTLGEFEDKLALGLRAHLEQLLPAAGPAARRSASHQGRPYLGLSAFAFEDAPVFFGRTAQVGAVVEAFQEQEMESRASGEEGRRFVLILGASGSGKSSLARAGVLPMLVQPGVIEGASVWRRATLRPGEAGADPFLALAQALLAPTALPELGGDGTTAAQLAGLLRRQPAGAGLLLRQALVQAGAAARTAEEQRLRDRLRHYESEHREEDAAELRERLGRLQPPPVRLALLADQLEELFTTEQAAQAASAWIEALRALATSGRIFVLGTLRSDFYPRCLEHPSLVELMRGNGSYALPAPGPAELGQMIRQPAAAAGLTFEEDAARGERLDELLRDAALRDPRALPLLSYTLEQLHERRSPEGLLTLAAYRELGGLEGAIGKRAESVFSALDGAAQAAFDAVWRLLVALGDDGVPVRRRAPMAALDSQAGAARLVESLVAARLLTADQDEGGGRSISVAHEALLRHWPRVVTWIEDNRDFLRARARLASRLAEWRERGSAEDDLLPPGPALAEAEAMLARHGSSLEEAERSYIERSTRRARDREQARLRRNRYITAGAVALSLVAAAGGAFAWQERGVAQRERASALRQKEAAETHARIARASQVRAAYLLGADTLDAGRTREGLTGLAQALRLDPAHAGARDRMYSYFLYGLPRAVGLRSIAGREGVRQRLSAPTVAGAAWAASFDGRGRPTVRQLVDGHPLAGPWEEAEGIVALGLCGSGKRLLGLRADGSCPTWSVPAGEPGPVLGISPDFTWLNLSQDGAWVFEGSQQGRLRLWDLAAGKVVSEWQQAGTVRAISSDPASQRVLVAAGDLVLYDIAQHRELARLADPEWECVGVQCAEDAPVAVVHETSRSGAGSRFRFLSTEDGSVFPGSRTLEIKEEVFDFAVARDGGSVAVAPFSETARLLSRDAESRDRSFKHATYAALVRLSPDRRLLATASPEGTVQVWDATSGTLAFEPIRHDSGLQDISISGDGRFLLTCTARHARVWDLAAGRALVQMLPAQGAGRALQWSEDGGTLWAVSAESGLSGWEGRSLEARPAPAHLGEAAAEMSLSPRGNCAAMLLPGRKIVCADLRQGRESAPWEIPSEPQRWVWSGDGRRLAVAGADGIHLLDTASGQPVGPVLPAVNGIQNLGLSEDGSRIAIVDAAGSVRLLSADGGPAADLPGAGFTARLLHFSADGRHLAASAARSGDARMFAVLLWDPADPAAAPRVLPHGDHVIQMEFSADSRWLATGTRDQVAQVWSVAEARPAADPIFHANNIVRLVRFSPDGTRLATHCGDGTLRIYDWREARPVSEAFALSADATTLAFSPDGTRLAVLDAGFARIYEVAPPPAQSIDLVALAEAATARRNSDDGPPVGCDPQEGWDRLRASSPDSWFLQDPARRSISPGFTSSSIRWIEDLNVDTKQTAVNLPAVPLVRAALSFWKQNSINARRKKLAGLAADSEEAKSEKEAIAEAERDVATLRAAAAASGAGDPDTFLWLSRQAEAAGETARAAECIAVSLRGKPEDVAILNQASDAFLAARDAEAALPVLQALRRAEPERGRHRIRLGFLLWRRGQPAEARAEWEPVLSSPDASDNDRGSMLLACGRVAEALRLSQERLQRETEGGNPATLDGLAFLAAARFASGDTDGAVSAFRDLIAREPAAANRTVLAQVDLIPPVVEPLLGALDATLARHPELAPKGD